MKIKKFTTQSKGAALVEYGILVGLIAVLAIVAVSTLGTTVQNTFRTVSSTLSTTAGLQSAGTQEDLTVPTAPAPASFSFTAAQWIPGETGVALTLDGNFSYGSFLSDTGAQTIELRTSINSVLAYSVEGDRTSEFAGLTLSCDNGISLAINSAAVVTYSPGTPSTYFQFNGYAGPLFTAGQTYTCSVS